MKLLSPQLIAFVSVVNNKTVHAGAAELCITQTAVTQRIKALEAHLKTTLFIRSRRGMELTSEGEALLRYCTAAQDLEGQALAQIQGTGTATEVSLSLCGPTSIMRSRVIPACVPLMSDFPELLFEFQIDDVGGARSSRLKLGKSDFVVVPKHELVDEMIHKQLAPESYVLVCTSAWKGRTLSEVLKEERIIDFDPTDQATIHYLEAYDLLGLSNPGRYYVNHTEMIADLVCQGVGYTALTREFVTPYVDAGQMIVLNNEQVYAVRSYLAWYKRPEPPHYFKQLVEAIA